MTTYIDWEDIKPGIDVIFDDIRDQIKKLETRLTLLELAFIATVAGKSNNKE